MRRIAWLLPLALGLVGCDDGAPERVITRTRTTTVAPKPFDPRVRSKDRFPTFPLRAGAGGGEAHGGDAPAAAPFSYDEPQGWHSHPPKGMRLLSFHVGGGHGAECTVIHLPGGGGGDLDNVNRWHKQMGLPAIDAAALAKLPKRTVLGAEGTLVELEGTYTGMNGGPQPDSGLVGVIVPHTLRGTAGVLFVKMTGPKAVIAGEKARFDAFCASLKPAAEADPHAGHNHGPGEGHGADDGHGPNDGHDHGAQESGPPRPAPAVSWTAPSGWTEGGRKPMREVTFKSPDSPGTECYVSVLKGPAGGLAGNVNRWRKQVGQAPLSEAELAALERIPMLGQQAALLEASGTFDGAAGAQAGHTLLGVVCPLEDVTVFVKMVGPSAEVAKERAKFLELCASLKQGGAE